MYFIKFLKRNLVLLNFLIVTYLIIFQIIIYTHKQDHVTLNSYDPQIDGYNNNIENKSSFFIITALFNPMAYKSRYDLFKKFQLHIETFNVNMIVVELAFQNQTFQVTNSSNPYHIQLHTDDILWYKENLINIAIRKLPVFCKYVAWIDADILFNNLNWVQDTINAFEKYKVVQLFEYANFLGPNSEILRIDTGFGFSYVTKKSFRLRSYVPYKLFYPNGTEIFKKSRHRWKNIFYWHPGFAWAAETTTLLRTNGLLEIAILGGGDRLMAYSFIDRAHFGLQKHMNDNYRREIHKWSQKIKVYIKSSVGYIPGNISHLWHGSLDDRQYSTREKILDHGSIQFDPVKHLYHDKNKVLKLSESFKPNFKSAVKEYYLNRNEDKQI